MKRPRAFFFVVAWCGLALLVQSSYLTRPARVYQAAGEPIPTLWYYLPLLAVALGVWQMVGLFRLKRFNRWLAVMFFISWSVNMFWRFAASPGPLTHPARVFVVLSIIAAFNLVSAWYLSRRSFRELAVQYVAEHKAEKHTRLMQIAAQKNTLNEIRKNKVS